LDNGHLPVITEPVSKIPQTYRSKQVSGNDHHSDEAAEVRSSKVILVVVTLFTRNFVIAIFCYSPHLRNKR